MSACIEQKKKIVCSRINKMVNVKRLSTLKKEISKEQDIVISRGVHSDSISLQILLCKFSALFWLSFRSLQRSIVFQPLFTMSFLSVSLPSQVLAKDTMNSLSQSPKVCIGTESSVGEVFCFKK